MSSVCPLPQLEGRKMLTTDESNGEKNRCLPKEVFPKPCGMVGAFLLNPNYLPHTLSPSPITA